MRKVRLVGLFSLNVYFILLPLTLTMSVISFIFFDTLLRVFFCFMSSIFILSVIFGYNCVEITPQGLKNRKVKHIINEFKWISIKEIGIVGIFPHLIYFSLCELNENGFRNLDSKNKATQAVIFCNCSKKILSEIRKYYSGEIKRR